MAPNSNKKSKFRNYLTQLFLIIFQTIKTQLCRSWYDLMKHYKFWSDACSQNPRLLSKNENHGLWINPNLGTVEILPQSIEDGMVGIEFST